jgi:hypothetical protein
VNPGQTARPYNFDDSGRRIVVQRRRDALLRQAAHALFVLERSLCAGHAGKFRGERGSDHLDHRPSDLPDQ